MGQPPPTVPRLLHEAHGHIAGLLDHPSVSPGERQRLAALQAEAIEQQSPAACMRYKDRAEALLAEAYPNPRFRPDVPEFDARMADLARLLDDRDPAGSPATIPLTDSSPARAEGGQTSRLDQADELLTLAGKQLALVRAHLDIADPDHGVHKQNIDDAIAWIEVARSKLPEAVGPVTGWLPSRIVLASPAGELFERGATPGQLWPTSNPLGALNWPDLPTAIAAVTGPSNLLAYAKAKDKGYVLKRARIVLEDLAEGEVEGAIIVTAARRAGAVAG